MVIAQELIGRPFISLFGIKMTTVIWFFIAIFLGLIFSMTMWPNIWRKIYHKGIGEPSVFRFVPWHFALIVFLVAVLFFIAGVVLASLV